MKQVLQGITVLDLSDAMAGSLAAAMLADFGATVIKVEKPGVGNSCRRLPPFSDGISLTDCRVNRGKQSVELDLFDTEDRGVIRKLAAKADIIVEDFVPGKMRELGLAYEDLSADHTSLIYCSVTAYGQAGPYARKGANELTVQAISGVMGTTGETGKTPQRHGFHMGSYAAAYCAYSAIITALCYRLESGEGQCIDVSMARALLYLNSAVERTTKDIFGGLEGNHHPTISPFGFFKGKNGQGIVICALNPKLWNALCELMEQPELMTDPRFITVSKRAENRLEVAALIEAWLQHFDNINDALSALEKASVPASLIYSTEDVINDPHVKSMGWIGEVPMPQGSAIKTYISQGPSFTLSKTPGHAGAAPVLGSANASVLASVGAVTVNGAEGEGEKR